MGIATRPERTLESGLFVRASRTRRETTTALFSEAKSLRPQR